jgi:hypothetical protein
MMLGSGTFRVWKFLTGAGERKTKKTTYISKVRKGRRK